MEEALGRGKKGGPIRRWCRDEKQVIFERAVELVAGLEEQSSQRDDNPNCLLVLQEA